MRRKLAKRLGILSNLSRACYCDESILNFLFSLRQILISKAVEDWTGLAEVKRFGVIAKDSPGLARVVMYLQSAKGREEVRSLIKEACPLHGTSQSNGGIAVCRDLFLEFSWEKAGDQKNKDPSVNAHGLDSSCHVDSKLSSQ